jgi:hypothetical protein
MLWKWHAQLHHGGAHTSRLRNRRSKVMGDVAHMMVKHACFEHGDDHINNLMKGDHDRDAILVHGRALMHRISIHCHCVGDRATSEVLDALEVRIYCFSQMTDLKVSGGPLLMVKGIWVSVMLTDCTLYHDSMCPDRWREGATARGTRGTPSPICSSSAPVMCHVFSP